MADKNKTNGELINDPIFQKWRNANFPQNKYIGNDIMLEAMIANGFLAGFSAGQKAEYAQRRKNAESVYDEAERHTAAAIFKAIKLSAIQPAPDSIKAMTLNNEKVAIIYLDKLEAIEREYPSASDKKV